MTILTKICAGLFVSSLALHAYAAQPGTDGQSPVQEPSEIIVEVSNPTEVIQVLHVGVESEIKIIDLVKERNPDADLRDFIEGLTQDVTDFQKRLEDLAASKSVGLAPQALTENARLIESQMSQEFKMLSAKQQADFRKGVIAALIMKYENALELYTQVTEKSADEELKGAVAELRPLTEKHLEAIRQLKEGMTQPTEPQD